MRRTGDRDVIRFGQFVPGSSCVHTLDPRVKIGWAVALSVVVLQGGSLCCALISVWLLLVVRTSHIPLRLLASALKPARVFLILLFLVHLLLTQGTPIPPFSDWAVTITYEGLRQGTLVCWQFAVLLTTGTLLTMSTTPGELVDGLERWLRPLRIVGIRSHDVALMVSLALRFVPTLLDEMQRVKEAQTSRGASFSSGGPIRRMRAAAALLIPVVLGAFRRGDELATAMEARGYHSGPRTTLHDLRMTSRDYAAAAFAVLILGGITLGDVFFHGL